MNGSAAWGLSCLVVSAVLGCETAQPVPEQGEPQTPTAPAIRETFAGEPGPQGPDAPEEFTTTDTGLKYRILREGTGEKPTAANTVTAHYKGWLDDGTVFDSSYERGEPASFPLLRVVEGWTEGLQHVREGGMIELEIPSELGYGPRGRPPTIPPNATLHFTVELIEVR